MRNSPYNSYSKKSSGKSGGTTVFVGNLSWNVDWKELKDHMKSAGEIEYAEIIKKRDGRSSGGGLVRYSTAGAAKKAIEDLTDTELDGRQIFVREDREAGSKKQGGYKQSYQSNGGSGTTVFVGNLSWNVDWKELKDHMRAAGEVVHADVLMKRDGRSSGAGLVQYATAAQAKKAIKQLTDSELDGRLIFVREDREGGDSKY